MSELFPSPKILEDKDNLETTTEIVRVQASRPSESLMNYLRSVLQNNYQGGDSHYIMISTPRLIEYELLVVEFAIDLLEHYGKTELFKRSTLEEDVLRAKAVADYRLRTVLVYNIEQKRVLLSHLKLLRVTKAILERIGVNKETFSNACFRRVEAVEEGDSDEEMYRRRMGLRHYFKDLKMNTLRIAKAKGAREATSQMKKGTNYNTQLMPCSQTKKASKESPEKSGEKPKAKKPKRDSSKSKAPEKAAAGGKVTPKKKPVKK